MSFTPHASLLSLLLACTQPIESPADADEADAELDEADLIAPGECLTKPRAGAWGYKYQCNGAFLARIGGSYGEHRAWFFIPSSTTTGFGQLWEPYERAKVMACCGEYDYEQTLEQQPIVAESCLLDFREQACASMAAGLLTLIDGANLPLAYVHKALTVQDWIASHQHECVAGFADTDPHPLMLRATWRLPNAIDGRPPPWAPLRDLYVEIIFAALSPEARPPHAPAGGPEPCTSLRDNDEHLFTGSSSLPPISSDGEAKTGRARKNGEDKHSPPTTPSGLAASSTL
ncbi:MAG: hypothetical protein R6X02_06520 [Enhygromyxa sp.]